MRYAITGVNASRSQEAAKWLLRFVATGHSANEHIAGFTLGRLQYLGTEVKPPTNLFQFTEGSESNIQIGPVFTSYDYIKAELRRADAILNHPCCESWQDAGLCTCGEQAEEDFVREERVDNQRTYRYFDSEIGATPSVPASNNGLQKTAIKLTGSAAEIASMPRPKNQTESKSDTEITRFTLLEID